MAPLPKDVSPRLVLLSITFRHNPRGWGRITQKLDPSRPKWNTDKANFKHHRNSCDYCWHSVLVSCLLSQQNTMTKATDRRKNPFGLTTSESKSMTIMAECKNKQAGIVLGLKLRAHMWSEPWAQGRDGDLTENGVNFWNLKVPSPSDTPSFSSKATSSYFPTQFHQP